MDKLIAICWSRTFLKFVVFINLYIVYFFRKHKEQELRSKYKYKKLKSKQRHAHKQIVTIYEKIVAKTCILWQ